MVAECFKAFTTLAAMGRRSISQYLGKKISANLVSLLFFGFRSALDADLAFVAKRWCKVCRTKYHIDIELHFE